MTEPDDRELEQYLKGDSALSRKYREASREGAPPELDAAILAQARAAVSRPRRASRPWFTGLALAASVMLAVNLGWNVYQSRPQLEERGAMKDVFADKDFVPSPPPASEKPQASVDAVAPAPVPAAPPVALDERKARAANEPRVEMAPPSASGMAAGGAAAEADAMREQESAKKAEAQDQALASRQAEEGALRRRDNLAQAPAETAAAPAAARAKVAALSEPEKIDRLIAYVGGLQNAVFIRNGSEYGPADAAKHLQLKRRQAGDQVRTADDFIRLCASYSSMSGKPYLIRFADGRTRTAEDVLREELARINAGG